MILRGRQRSVEEWIAVDPLRLQKFARWLIARPGRWVIRYKAYYAAPVPTSGGTIIAPNHGSQTDPLVCAFGTIRPIRFMSKYEALAWPVIGRIIEHGGGFPVRRKEKGQPALEIAKRILRAGGMLMMFPEGRVWRDSEDHGPPKKGVAVLALQTGAQVVPVALYGNKNAKAFGRKTRPWRRRRVTVVWGEAMTWDTYEDPSEALVESVRDEIWSEVLRLYDIAKEIHVMNPRPDSFAVPKRNTDYDSDTVFKDGGEAING